MAMKIAVVGLGAGLVFLLLAWHIAFFWYPQH